VDVARRLVVTRLIHLSEGSRKETAILIVVASAIPFRRVWCVFVLENGLSCRLVEHRVHGLQ
jgi:hypothetical protein